jgi:hypothetical protein
MMDVSLTCAKCQGHMETGFIVDRTRYGPRVSEWVVGTPTTGFLGD